MSPCSTNITAALIQEQLSMRHCSPFISALRAAVRVPGVRAVSSQMDVKWIVDPAASIVSTDCRTGKVASNPSATDLVVYHKDCPDGFAAAFGAWKLLGDRAVYVAAAHGPQAPNDLDVRGKHVVVVDYCFPRAVTQRMIGEAASFLVLDHHVSALAELADVDEGHKVMEMKQSGATLSWNYFHGSDVPALLRYIEDKDIWRWALKDSKEFSAGFNPSYDFSEWDAAFCGGEAAVLDIITKGKAILSYKETVIRAHVARAVPCTMKAAPAFRGMLVNASVMASEIGNALSTQPGVDFALMWWFDYETMTNVCSLRSASDAVDVAAMAKTLGGGGHKRASGFSFAGKLEDVLSSINGRAVE